jgi:hypothetical protein
MFAGVQRANYILNLKIRLISRKNQVIAEAFSCILSFELVKWFGIPMKGDARFSPGDEKKIPRSSKYTLLLKQT